MAANTLVDREEIQRAYSLLAAPGQVIEARVLEGTVVSHNGQYPATYGGYFNNVESLLSSLSQIRKAKGVYITLQNCKPNLIHRTYNELMKQHQGNSTSDSDITGYRWLLIDSDPDRDPTNISASNEEHARALEHSRMIAEQLTARGWPAPVIADSGNGGHLLYRIDLAVEEKDLVKRVLEGLARLYDTSGVHVDQTVFNPARICKLYGTLVCKGANTTERPHRMSRLIEVPEHIEIVGRELLEEIAIPDKSPPLILPDGIKESFSAQGFLDKHHIDTYPSQDYAGGTRWQLKQCAWDSSHTDRSACIYQFPDGRLGASCSHNSCKGLGWKDFRQVFEPDAYTSRILGKTEFRQVPTQMTVIATGNNVQVDRDAARRCLFINLITETSQPDTRTDFTIKHLTQYVLEHRNKIVVALLTLIRAWFVAGQPIAKERTAGTFSQWATTIGAILDHAGIFGFMGNRETAQKEANSDEYDMERFLKCWHNVFGEEYKPAREIVETITQKNGSTYTHSDWFEALPAELLETFGSETKPLASKVLSFTKWLQKNLRTPFGDTNIRIEQEKEKHTKRSEWRVHIPKKKNAGVPPNTQDTYSSHSTSHSIAQIAGVAGVAGVDLPDSATEGKNSSQESVGEMALENTRNTRNTRNDTPSSHSTRGLNGINGTPATCHKLDTDDEGNVSSLLMEEFTALRRRIETQIDYHKRYERRGIPQTFLWNASGYSKELLPFSDYLARVDELKNSDQIQAAIDAMKRTLEIRE